MNVYELFEPLDEKWSKKYKRSINCANPRGFSQKAHCAGRSARQSGHKTKSSSINEDSNTKFLHKYIPWLQKELGLDRLPNIKFVPSLEGSFGTYDSDEKILYLVTQGRHPVDVLRTMAHELTHYKQDCEGRLNLESGETGSPEENEANAKAGIALRKFAQANPDCLDNTVTEAEPEVLPPASTDYNQASYNRPGQASYNVPLQNIPAQKLQLINQVAAKANELLPDNMPAQVPGFEQKAEQVLGKIQSPTLATTVKKYIKKGLENPTWQGVILGVLMTCVARATVGVSHGLNMSPADTTIALEFLLPGLGNILGYKMIGKHSWKDSIKAGAIAGAAGGGTAIALKGMIGEADWRGINYGSDTDINHIPGKMVYQGFVVTFNPATKEVTISKENQVLAVYTFPGTPSYKNFRTDLDKRLEKLMDKLRLSRLRRLKEDFTGKAKPGSRPGSLRRKAGLKKGQTMSQADLLRLSGRANSMKKSKNKATRDRGIQLARQVNWYKNFHKKKSEAVGFGE